MPHFVFLGGGKMSAVVPAGTKKGAPSGGGKFIGSSLEAQVPSLSV